MFKEIVYKIRNVRGEMNIPPDKKANVVFKTENDAKKTIVEREAVHIKALARVEEIIIDKDYTPDSTDASAVLADIEIYLPLKGLIDIDKEKARLEKEIGKVKADLERVEKKLTNENFIGKAPKNIIDKEKAKAAENKEILEKLEASLKKLA